MDAKQLYEKTNSQFKPFFPIVRLEDIIDKITEKSIQWILNNYNHIYVEYSESRSVTRNKVPAALRRTGLWITYYNVNRHITEYFLGENQEVNNPIHWGADEHWREFDKVFVTPGCIEYQHLSDALKELLANGNTITNFPDEEDLTTDGAVLTFKNREQDVDRFIPTGRIILRRNIKIIDGQYKNILEQEFINKASTIYEIRYNFDLNGQTIRVPENSILFFNGGRIINGIMQCHNTDFINVKSFEDTGNATYQGTFKKGLVMYKDNTVMWYDGIEWKLFMTDSENPLPENISAVAEAYDSNIARAEATVNNQTGLFSFRFGIPKGKDGKDGVNGLDGKDGKDGTSPIGHKTIMIFKSQADRPSTPVGGVWDVEANTITIPTDWSKDDNLPSPVWMSIGEFTSDKPSEPTWTTPIRITGKDGVNGADGTTTEFIYKRSTVELSIPDDTPPNDPNMTDYVPEGWEDHPFGISKDWPYEYVCTRTKDSETGLWGDWEGPVIWSKWGTDGRDGDGVEYIYQRTKEEVKPATPGKTPSVNSPVQDYQEREFLPAPSTGELEWTDNPSGVSEEYLCEWISQRKFNFDTQLWGDFTEPSLWAKYGQKGDAGTSISILGSYEEIGRLFEAKENGTLTGNNPPEVGDSYIVQGDIYIWDGDDFINGGRIQGEPGQSVYFHIKYSDDGRTFTSNNGEDVGKFIGTRVDYVEEDSNVFSDYTWSQFKGNDGFGYEYIFKRTTTFVAPSVPTEVTESDVAPSGWTDDPTGVDENTKYEWCCYRKSDKDGKWSDWRGKKDSTKAWLFAMYAEGIPGATGGQGPILYPAGVFDNTKEYNQTIKTNSEGKEYVHATPYVLYDGEYLVLQVASYQGNTPTTEDGSWLQMDKFNAIYTDILLANNALVGSAVFNGNYIFSQKGVNASGVQVNNYQDFNHDDPYSVSNSFRPNWCVNLVTGEQWMCSGKAKVGLESITYQKDNSTLTIREYLSLVTQLSNFTVSENYILYQTTVADTESGGTKTIEPFRLMKDGTGMLANGVIRWNADGSGTLANGKVEWDSDGNVLADFYDDASQLNDTVYNVTLPKIIAGYNKTVRVPICAISRTATQNKLVAASSSTKFKLVDEDGRTYTGTGSISHQQTSMGYGYYDCFGFVDEEGVSYWYVKEVIVGTAASSGSSNVEFVDSLPSSPDSNKLYVVV